MNTLHKDLQSKGFLVFAVNPGIDGESTIKEYWKKGGFAFDTIATEANNSIVSQYGVAGFPTNYLIGKDGKILWRGVGFNESAIVEALRKVGLEKQ